MQAFSALLRSRDCGGDVFLQEVTTDGNWKSDIPG
jgi:hypothetical protein